MKKTAIEAIRTANANKKTFNASFLKSECIEVDTEIKFAQASKAIKAIAIMCELYASLQTKSDFVVNGKSVRTEAIRGAEKYVSDRINDLYHAWGLQGVERVTAQYVLGVALSTKIDSDTGERVVTYKSGATLTKNIMAGICELSKGIKVSATALSTAVAEANDKMADKPKKSTKKSTKKSSYITEEALARRAEEQKLPVESVRNLFLSMGFEIAA